MRIGRRIAVGALALLAVAVLLASRGGGSSSDPAPVARESERRGGEPRSIGVAPRRSPPRERVSPTPVRTADREVTSARLIESVRFEPEQPCVGDDVVVHTTLHAPDAKVFVDGRPGAPQVVRARDVGRQRVRVMARTWGDEYERRVVTMPVDECADAPPRLGARIRATIYDQRSYVFTLEPAPGGTVQWELGDGATHDGASASHVYAVRSDRPQSTYLVRARYTGPSGPETARISVTHAEPEGIAARTAFPLLEEQGESFVQWDTSDGLRTTRHVRNGLDEDVALAVAEVRGFPCDGSPVQAVQTPIGEIADIDVIPAGQSVDVSLTIGAERFDRPVCHLLVRMVGDAGGRLASTVTALDTGIPDERHPIEDPELLQIIGAIAERDDDGRITAQEIAEYRARMGAM